MEAQKIRESSAKILVKERDLLSPKGNFHYAWQLMESGEGNGLGGKEPRGSNARPAFTPGTKLRNAESLRKFRSIFKSQTIKEKEIQEKYATKNMHISPSSEKKNKSVRDETKVKHRKASFRINKIKNKTQQDKTNFSNSTALRELVRDAGPRSSKATKERKTKQRKAYTTGNPAGHSSADVRGKDRGILKPKLKPHPQDVSRHQQVVPIQHFSASSVAGNDQAIWPWPLPFQQEKSAKKPRKRQINFMESKSEPTLNIHDVKNRPNTREVEERAFIGNAANLRTPQKQAPFLPALLAKTPPQTPHVCSYLCRNGAHHRGTPHTDQHDDFEPREEVGNGHGNSESPEHFKEISRFEHEAGRLLSILDERVAEVPSHTEHSCELLRLSDLKSEAAQYDLIFERLSLSMQSVPQTKDIIDRTRSMYKKTIAESLFAAISQKEYWERKHAKTLALAKRQRDEMRNSENEKRKVRNQLRDLLLESHKNAYKMRSEIARMYMEKGDYVNACRIGLLIMQDHDNKTHVLTANELEETKELIATCSVKWELKEEKEDLGRQAAAEAKKAAAAEKEAQDQASNPTNETQHDEEGNPAPPTEDEDDDDEEEDEEPTGDPVEALSYAPGNLRSALYDAGPIQFPLAKTEDAVDMDMIKRLLRKLGLTLLDMPFKAKEGEPDKFIPKIITKLGQPNPAQLMKEEVNKAKQPLQERINRLENQHSENALKSKKMEVELEKLKAALQEIKSKRRLIDNEAKSLRHKLVCATEEADETNTKLRGLDKKLTVLCSAINVTRKSDYATNAAVKNPEFVESLSKELDVCVHKAGNMNSAPKKKGVKTYEKGTSTNADVDDIGSVTYQWHKDDVPIEGATEKTYALKDSDVGKKISVDMTFKSEDGKEESTITSVATAPVISTAPIVASIPTLPTMIPGILKKSSGLRDVVETVKSKLMAVNAFKGSNKNANKALLALAPKQQQKTNVEAKQSQTDDTPSEFAKEVSKPKLTVAHEAKPMHNDNDNELTDVELMQIDGVAKEGHVLAANIKEFALKSFMEKGNVIEAKVYTPSKLSAKEPVEPAKPAPTVPMQRKKSQEMKGIKQISEEQTRGLLDQFSEHTGLFDSFTGNNLESMMHYMDVINFKKGDWLVKQGEEASWTGFILKGSIDVHIEGPGIVAQMHQGEIMGEMAYLSGAKRSASCIGATDGIMAAIPFEKLDCLHEEDAELAMKLQRALALASMDKKEQNHKRQIAKIKKEKGIVPAADTSVTNASEEPSGGNKSEKVGDASPKNEGGPGAKKKKRQSIWQRTRKKIQGRGLIKREKKSFLGSSNTEIFYRNMVAKHKKSATDMEEETKQLKEKTEKQKQKLRTEAVLRKGQDRKMKKMEEQIALLKAELENRLTEDEREAVLESVHVSETKKGSAIDKFRKSVKRLSHMNLKGLSNQS
jgi:CRP-like cAMP-binding protein